MTASEAPDTPGVVAPPPLIFAGALGLGFALNALAGPASLPRAIARPLGIALIASGAGLGASFVAAFRRANTPVDPRRPAAALVTTGPYRLTRNPGYVGLTLLSSGIAVLAGALWAFVPLAGAVAVVDRGVIRREERHLERRFGEEYRRYKARTRRWL